MKILLLALFAVAFCDTNVIGYDRVITILRNHTNFGAIDAANTLDPLHLKMIGTGLYTAVNAAAVDTESWQWANDIYGVNVTAGTPLGGGIWRDPLGKWQVIPFFLRTTHRVAMDSEYSRRGNTEEWQPIYSGNILVFTAAGTIPGGVNAGKLIEAGDGGIYSYYDLVTVNGDITKKYNREHFVMRTDRTVKQPTNMFGTKDVTYLWRIWNEDGVEGAATMAEFPIPKAGGLSDLWQIGTLSWIKTSDHDDDH